MNGGVPRPRWREAVRAGTRQPDAVARAPHEASLFDLQAKYAEVVSLAEAERYLDSV
jgi:hypothetical protein